MESELLFTGTLIIPGNSTASITCKLSKSILDYQFVFVAMSKSTGSGVSFVPTSYIDTSYPTGGGDNVIYNNYESHSYDTGVSTTARVISDTSIGASGRQYGWSGANNFTVAIYGIGRSK